MLWITLNFWVLLECYFGMTVHRKNSQWFIVLVLLSGVQSQYTDTRMLLLSCLMFCHCIPARQTRQRWDAAGAIWNTSWDPTECEGPSPHPTVPSKGPPRLSCLPTFQATHRGGESGNLDLYCSFAQDPCQTQTANMWWKVMHLYLFLVGRVKGKDFFPRPERGCITRDAETERRNCKLKEKRRKGGTSGREERGWLRYWVTTKPWMYSEHIVNTGSSKSNFSRDQYITHQL